MNTIIPNVYQKISESLMKSPKTWLVTGCAGFIGSNLVESLIRLKQKVVGIDNFSTGKKSNLEDINKLGLDTHGLFRFYEGDVTNTNDVMNVAQNVDVILHQAALGSVPRSIENPLNTHHHNVTGHLTVLDVARRCGIKRIVYASSSSVYGDHPELPKIESKIGNQLSPYAVSKYTNELYSSVFSKQYGLETVGLRYFNVFGKRQDPFGAYAAVIPLWVKSLIKGESTFINGDGETSRDFCYIDNVVQANILAGAITHLPNAAQVYNVAYGERTNLVQLHQYLVSEIKNLRPEIDCPPPIFREQRAGDVRHSLASINKISQEIGYSPTHNIRQGLSTAISWYVDNLAL